MGKIVKLVSILACFGLFLAGCALFQTPPVNPDQKAAWIQQTQVALDNAMFAESAAFIVFGGFCGANQIDAATCSLGIALNDAWQKDYPIAKDAVARYGRGEITQLEAQRLVDYAMLTDLTNVMAVFMSGGNKLVKERALKTNRDLIKPTGKK